MINVLKGLAAVALSFAVTGSASAAFVNYTENFDTNFANWKQASSGTDAVWNSGNVLGSPGPAGVGDAYISGSFNLPTGTSGTPVILRATGVRTPPPNGPVNTSASASGGAFVGDYSRVDEISVYVKHNADRDLPIGLRLATPTGGVAMAITGPLTPANVWTKLTFDIDWTNPDIVTYEILGNPASSLTPTQREAAFNAVVPNILTAQLFLYLGHPDFTARTTGEGALNGLTISADAMTVPEPTALVPLAAAFALLRRRRVA